MRAALLAFAALLAACTDFDSAAEAYRDGRFADAHRAFRDSTDAAGAGASAELLYDRALAALRAGDHRDAEASAKASAARGGAEFEGLRDFVLGNVAFARCELAEAQAKAVESEPFAFDVALKQAESARAGGPAAATTREDWPAARRNVERALRKLEQLREAKAAAERKSRKEPDARPRPRPAPPPPPPLPSAKPDAADATIGAEERELPREDVLRLLDLLQAKDQEKLATRRARQRAQTGGTEKDW